MYDEIAKTILSWHLAFMPLWQCTGTRVLSEEGLGNGMLVERRWASPQHGQLSHPCLSVDIRKPTLTVPGSRGQAQAVTSMWQPREDREGKAVTVAEVILHDWAQRIQNQLIYLCIRLNFLSFVPLLPLFYPFFFKKYIYLFDCARP